MTFSVKQLPLALLVTFALFGSPVQAAKKQVAALSAAQSEPEVEILDPFEPVNRGVFMFNEVFDAVVTTPVNFIYTNLLPDPVRRGIGNVFDNLDDVYIGVNHGLQGRPNLAGTDFARVLINTSIGAGGLFDVASDMGLAKGKGDYGVTLGVWGVGPGPFLVLPVLGVSNLRDTVGRGLRIASDPRTYLEPIVGYSLSGAEYIHVRSSSASTEDLISSSSLDKYRFTRSLFLQRRDALINAAKQSN
jgi:phospholipid-binding lipoprotein MlaA